jgi:hypothetical protein
MGRGRRVIGARLGAASFVVALLVMLSCGEITKEELACEQAVSRLRDCCDGLDARRLPCVDSSGGCASGEAKPVLTPRAASCVLDSDCGHYQSNGGCDRIVQLSLVPHAEKDLQEIELEACR